MSNNKKFIFFFLILLTSLFEILPSIIFKIYFPNFFNLSNFKSYMLIFLIFMLWTVSILIWLYCIKLFYYSISLFYLICFDLIFVLIIDIFIFIEEYNFMNIAGVFIALSAIYILKNEKIFDFNIIIPVFNEDEVIEDFNDNLQKVLNEIDFKFNIIYVNDGSRDQTENILNKLSNKNTFIEVINFTRNFGSHSAILAGLSNYREKPSIVMSCDFQDPPILIKELINKYIQNKKLFMQ